MKGRSVCFWYWRTFQSPGLALLRDLDLDLERDLERDLDIGAGRSRLVLLSRVRLTDQVRGLVSMGRAAI